jgi:hypothetical protein
MKDLTRNELEQFVGKTLHLITLNGGLLRNRDCAFFAAVDKEAAIEYGENVRRQLPDGDYQFSTVEMHIDDVSNFNQLFNGNYPSFQIVDYGNVNATEIFQYREEMVVKVEEVYKNGQFLFYPVAEDGRAMGFPQGNTHVVISYFTNPDEAAELSNGVYGERGLEDWMTIPTPDAAIFTIDGEIVYGWEMVEGAHRACKDLMVDAEELKSLLNGQALRILGSDDGSGAIMRCKGLPIFFISKDALVEFAEENRSEMDREYFDMEIAKPEGVKLVLDDYPFAIVDGDRRYYCASEELLKVFE